jgi:uncharacterized ferredoxin-like protein
MTLFSEEKKRKETIFDVAKRMMIAARTAPKARGIDNLVLACIDAESISQVSKKMKEKVDNEDWPQFFRRDAESILSAPYLVLIGTRIKPVRLKKCGLCGYADCDEKDKYPDHPCSFNTGDLGIAIGSAVSIAMDNRVDNRVLYSVGIVVREMGLFDEDIKIIYGIPLSVSAKNPFFDRG